MQQFWVAHKRLPASPNSSSWPRPPQTRTCMSDLPQLVGTFAWQVGSKGKGGEGCRPAAACSSSSKGKRSVEVRGWAHGLNASRSFAARPHPSLRRAAPEVLMGGRGCTVAIDVYSFGVLLWEASGRTCLLPQSPEAAFSNRRPWQLAVVGRRRVPALDAHAHQAASSCFVARHSHLQPCPASPCPPNRSSRGCARCARTCPAPPCPPSAPRRPPT